MAEIVDLKKYRFRLLGDFEPKAAEREASRGGGPISRNSSNYCY